MRTPEVSSVGKFNSSLGGERVPSLPEASTAAVSEGRCACRASITNVLEHQHVAHGVTGTQVVTGALSIFALQKNIRERFV